MTQGLRVKRSLERIRRGLVWAAGAVLVVAVAVAMLMPSHPWLSALLAAASSLAMFAVSLGTMTKATASELPSIGWIALDYVVKVGLVAGSLLAAKNLPSLEVQVVAGLVILAVVLNMFVQVWAFMVPPSPVPDEAGD